MLAQHPNAITIVGPLCCILMFSMVYGYVGLFCVYVLSITCHLPASLIQSSAGYSRSYMSHTYERVVFICMSYMHHMVGCECVCMCALLLMHSYIIFNTSLIWLEWVELWVWKCSLYYDLVQKSVCVYRLLKYLASLQRHFISQKSYPTNCRQVLVYTFTI